MLEPVAPEAVRLIVVLSLLLPSHVLGLFGHIAAQHLTHHSHSPTGPADDFESFTMKVTVTFGQTGVVVPCKDGWTVRDLIQQATLRYRKLLEQVRFIKLSFLFFILFFFVQEKTQSLWLLH